VDYRAISRERKRTGGCPERKRSQGNGTQSSWNWEERGIIENLWYVVEFKCPTYA